MILLGFLIVGLYSGSMIQLGDKVHYCEMKNYQEDYCKNLKKVKEFKEKIHFE